MCLPSLTYHEAWEMSYFGANVLHPRTTLPAMKYNIPITIRNIFNLAAPGMDYRWCEVQVYRCIGVGCQAPATATGCQAPATATLT